MGRRRRKSAVKAAAALASAADGESGNKGKRNAEGDTEKAAKKQITAPVEVVPVENDLGKAKISSDGDDETVYTMGKRRRRRRRRKSAVNVAPAPASAADGKSGNNGKRNAEGDTEKAAKKQKTAPVEVLPVENDLGKAKISSDGDDEDLPPKEPVAKKMEESSERSDSEDEHTTAKIVGSSKAVVSEKTVFVGNLSFNVDKEQVKQFFQEAGEIIHIRLATFDDGSSRGFAHVEFATTEAAQKACKLNGFDLMGRPVMVDFAQERVAFTPGSRNVFRKDKPGQSSSNTAFIRGFDSSIGQDQIRSSLLKHFSSCGEITSVRIPKDLQTGKSKGIAYMVFSDNGSVSKAKELRGSDLGGFSLYVNEAKPKPDNRDGAVSMDMPPKVPAAKKMEESSESPDSEDEDTTAKIVGSPKAFVSKKTVFVGNLSYNVDKEQVKQFFQEAGEIIDIRVATSKGYAHVEFATTEAAQKACKLNGFDLMGRPVRLIFPQERGAFTPGSGRDTPGQSSSSTAFIKGFDSSIGEDQIRSSLLKHFSSCGEITGVRIPKDHETGASKGIAYMDFSDNSSLSKALELSGSDLCGFSLYVDEGGRTRPTRGCSDSRGRRGRSFGRGDRGCGGRGGAPHRQSAAVPSTLQGRRYLAVMNERAKFSEDAPTMFLQKMLE